MMPDKVLHSSRKTFTFTGWHMLALMVFFFGTIITVNSILVMKALQSFPGVDTKQSYRQGLAYNDTLDSRARQKQLEWTADITVTDEHKIILTIFDKAALPVRGLKIIGTLKHPTRTDLDVALHFTQNLQTGLYEAQLDAGQKGKKWLLTNAVYANAKSDAHVFATRNELWLK